MEPLKHTFLLTTVFLFLNKVLDYCISMVYFTVYIVPVFVDAKLLLFFEFVMVEILP